MKKKEVEDILGGKGAWDNVDQTNGATPLNPRENKAQC
jgi:DNA-directed RNA polymerase III subunit RPC11